jgi:bifunctional DNA-binding transcriptional regulator/antitoxin component of YhaV-PrlF toxin-antitoxin module
MIQRLVKGFCVIMIDRDEEREERIHNEAIVDAYGPEEQALGWYYYLQDRITFPCKARCIAPRKTLPLKVGEVVEIIEMADEDDCMNDMIVIIRFGDRTFGVPLAQLDPIAGDETMIEAIKDWHYWVGRGYTF